MEGMEHLQDILEELDGVSLADQEKILHRNTAGLNERRPAWERDPRLGLGSQKR